MSVRDGPIKIVMQSYKKQIPDICTKKTQPSYNLRKIKVLDILDMINEYQIW